MNANEPRPKPWLLTLLDENEQIIPASFLGVLGVAAFVGVFWLLTTTEGRNMFSRFTPAQSESAETIAAQDRQIKETMLAALATGNSQPLDDQSKREVLQSLAERIDAGKESILSNEDKVRVLAEITRPR